MQKECLKEEIQIFSHVNWKSRLGEIKMCKSSVGGKSVDIAIEREAGIK